MGQRLKSIYGDKKTSVKKLIEKSSHGSREIEKKLETEFRELTKIGNTFQIRHFETDTEVIPTDDFREYLYFRILSLISYCINTIS